MSDARVFSDAVSHVQRCIHAAQKSSPIAAAHITLLAASKDQPVTAVEAMIEAGVTDFGENRLQEALRKWPPIQAQYPTIRLHAIGPLQTNKVKAALALFDVIQTIDRETLVDAIAAQRTPVQRCQTFYLQVNTGEEPQKSGVHPTDVAALLDYATQKGLPITGLLCIPPTGVPVAAHFALLRRLAQHHHIPHLSMGMSEDFETAVRMGSNCVRIGRALFGPRPSQRS